MAVNFKQFNKNKQRNMIILRNDFIFVDEINLVEVQNVFEEVPCFRSLHFS